MTSTNNDKNQIKEKQRRKKKYSVFFSCCKHITGAKGNIPKIQRYIKSINSFSCSWGKHKIETFLLPK